MYNQVQSGVKPITNKKSDCLFVIGGIWDLLLWHAHFQSRQQPFCGDVAVFSKAFAEDELRFIQGVCEKSGLSSIQYRDENDLLSRIESNDYRNLYLSHLSDAFSGKLLRVIGHLYVSVLFEGLAAYVPPRAIHSLLSSVDCYVFYGESLPLPIYIKDSAVVRIESTVIRDSVDYFYELLKLGKEFDLEYAQADLLVVGQHFYRHKLIQWEDELSIYSNAITESAKEGASLVLWKEHPRSTRPFYTDLSSHGICRVVEASHNKLIPTEIYASKMKPSVNVKGICSNTLFNLRDLFGFNVETLLAEELLHRFNYGKIERMALINFWGFAYLQRTASFTPQVLATAFGFGVESINASIVSNDSHAKVKARFPRSKPNAFIRFLRRRANFFMKYVGLEIVYR
jgi:hypothetical protein